MFAFGTAKKTKQTKKKNSLSSMCRYQYFWNPHRKGIFAQHGVIFCHIFILFLFSDLICSRANAWAKYDKSSNIWSLLHNV